MRKARITFLALTMILSLSVYSQAFASDVRQETDSLAQRETAYDDGGNTTPELLLNAEPYTPVNDMEADEVSADTMGEVLCDETMPDGTRIVCYQDQEDAMVKYWAVRKGDMLTRFCQEESAYRDGYAVEPFSDVLGESGFRILAPRGAAYFAYDYYVLDENGIPKLLADCANQVDEVDLNGDGETDLRWYYHGGQEVFAYFRSDGVLYSSCLREPA